MICMKIYLKCAKTINKTCQLINFVEVSNNHFKLFIIFIFYI